MLSESYVSSVSFTDDEVEVLILEVTKHSRILFGELKGPCTASAKQLLWKGIAKAVSAVCNNRRSVEDLKNKWMEVKCSVKAKASAFNKQKTITGEDLGTFDLLTSSEMRILEIIDRDGVEGILRGLDSSAFNCKDAEDLAMMKEELSRNGRESLEATQLDSAVKDEDDTMLACTLLDNYSSSVNLRKHTLMENLSLTPPGELHDDSIDGRFKCLRCSSSFVQRQSMIRHMRDTHGEVMQRVSVSKITNCSICGTAFTRRSSLVRHLKSAHTEGINQVRSAPVVFNPVVAYPATSDSVMSDPVVCPVNSYFCNICNRKYKNESALNIHTRLKHRTEPVRKRNGMKCSIESCIFTCQQRAQLVKHLNTKHNLTLKTESVTFRSDSDFEDWLHRLEEETPCRFVKMTGKSAKRNYDYYYCSRSGQIRNNIVARRRRFKVQGTSKIGRACPAHVVLRRKSFDCLEVQYIAKHLCYNNIYEQLGHLTLSEADRKLIACKLSLKIPHEDVLRDLHTGLDRNLKRIHITTKKDLLNIERAFGLNKPESCRTEEETARILQLSRRAPLRRIPDLESNREAAVQLLSDMQLFVHSIQDNQQMLTVVEHLKAMRPKLDLGSACGSETASFLQMTDSTSEQSNKSVEHQSRNKKRRIGVLKK